MRCVRLAMKLFPVAANGIHSRERQLGAVSIIMIRCCAICMSHLHEPECFDSAN